jgi:replicative DNA helicase
MMVADACNIGCDEIYDSTLGRWRSNGPALPTLYISTELEISEVQTMCVAFLSDVSESKILGAELMTFEEKERVAHAVRVLQNSEVYIDSICDFGIKDIESSIKKNHREHGVMYVFFDYLMTTIKIISEMTNSSKGMALREDTILFMFAVKLKDLANELGIFILSSTQLNATWKSEPVPDQNMLRGAKSLADKVDVGTVLLDVTEDDLEKIRPLLSRQPIVPNVKMSVYKNRRGAYNRIFLWMYADKGTCRYEALFATDYNYRPIILNETSLTVVKEEAPEEVIPAPVQKRNEFKNEFDDDDDDDVIPEPVLLTTDIGDDYEF